MEGEVVVRGGMRFHGYIRPHAKRPREDAVLHAPACAMAPVQNSDAAPTWICPRVALQCGPGCTLSARESAGCCEANRWFRTGDKGMLS